MTASISHHIRAIELALEMMPKIGIEVPETITKSAFFDHGLNCNALDLHQELNFYSQLLKYVNDPLLGIKLAKTYRPEAFGFFGFAMLSAPTLRGVIDLIIQFQELTYSIQKMSFDLSGDKASFNMTTGSLKLSKDIRRFYADRDLGCAHFLFSTLIGSPINISQVYLVHDSADKVDGYTNHFNAPVTFKSRSNSLVFDAKILDIPLPYRNESAFEECVKICRNQLAQLGENDDLISIVRRQFTLRPGYLHDINSIARHLNMSERTLRRRLEKLGTTFQVLRQEMRFEMASGYLVNSAISLSDIAELVGYSEPANFTHAFKRWSGGFSPKQFRTHGDLSQ